MKTLRKISKRYYFRQMVCCWMIFCMAFIMPAKIAMAATPVPTADGPLGDGFVHGAGAWGPRVGAAVLVLSFAQAVALKLCFGWI